VRRLAELNIYVILSFHAFDAQTSVALHGRDLVATKLRAIDNLTRAGVRMTLLNVMVRGVNESAAGQLLELMRGNEAVLSLTIQTMTYTGRAAVSLRVDSIFRPMKPRGSCAGNPTARWRSAIFSRGRRRIRSATRPASCSSPAISLCPWRV